MEPIPDAPHGSHVVRLRRVFLDLIGLPPTPAQVARWMNDNLFGVTVPEATLARLEGAADQAAEGRRICVELIQALREVPHVAGVHIMAPLQGSEAIAAVIEEAG